MAEIEYAYKPQGPTLARYLQSKVQRTIITGPLGCLPGDSEFLTPTGWKRMDAYHHGDEVAVWKDGVVAFEQAEHVTIPMRDAEQFIRFGTGNLVMELSSEHTVPYFDYRGVFQTVKAGQMAERPSIRHIPTTFALDRPDAPISDAEIRLRVMIAADGHYPKAGNQCIICVRKPRKVHRIPELLSACGIQFDRRTNEGRPTEITFVFQRPFFEKSLSFVWGLSTRQLGVVVEEAMLWDGLANHDELRFFTALPESADAIQFAAHATGRRASIRVRTYEGKDWLPTVNVYIANHGSKKNAANVGRKTEIQRFDSQDGLKYCFTTSTGYFVARCQGTVFVTGNSSKTNASCWKSFRVMLDQAPDADGVRRTRGLAVRNTYPDLFGTTIKDWLEMFGDLGKFSKGGMEPPTHRLKFRLDDGTTVDAEMIFLALDRPDHVKKLRGMQLTFAWLNEVKELMFPILEMVDLRIGRFPMNPTWYGMFGDTNAPDTDHWLYRLSEEIKPEGWLFLKQPGGLIRKSADAPWELNPLAENVQNLPVGYYVKGAQGKTESWIKVNLANEYGFVADGKPVYPDYRDSVHCKDFELVKGLPVHIGLDFGLTPAAIFGQRMVNGQWRWRYELVTTDTGVIRFANNLKDFIREHLDGFTIGRITGDPAGDQRQAGDSEERTVFQLLDANGIKSEPAHTNDFAIRTEAVANPLRRMIDGEPGFLIHSDCKVTRKGMQGAYKFRRMHIAGEERYRDVPEKNAQSHPCEAGQYLMLGGGEGTAAITIHSADTEEVAKAYREMRGLTKSSSSAAAFRRRRGH